MVLFTAGIDGLQSPESLTAEALVPLRASREEYERKKLELEDAAPDAPALDMAHEIGAARSHIHMTAEGACAGLRQISEVRIRAARNLRYFRYVHRLFRNAYEPDPWLTAFLTLIFILGEGTMAGLLMIGGGKLGYIAGFGYGYSFAALNVIVGLSGGFFARWINHRKAPPPSKAGAWLRRAGAAALIAHIGLLLLLIFSAGRTRALGDHAGIWDFETLGLFATYDDSLAIAVTVLGVVASLIALYKGFTGLCDPVPGYRELEQQALKGPNEQALGTWGQAGDEIAGVCQDAIADGEARLAKVQAAQKNCRMLHRELIVLWLAHNQDVLSRKDKLRDALNETVRAQAYIEHQPPEPVAVDLSAFDALLIAEKPCLPDLDAQATAALRAGLNAVGTGAARACNRIDAAYSAFLADAPDLSASNEGGSL